MPTIDILGLERCAICTNAHEHDADPRATAIWRACGNRGFLCRWCAWRYRDEIDEAEGELNND